MDYQTKDLILHFVRSDDWAEVARTWPSDHHPLLDAEAREAIAYMRGNYGRNAKGCIYHLCLAVCGKDHPGTFMGWCGLDGTRNHAEPEIFILLDEPYRNRGYGTQCVRELLRIAAEDYALPGVTVAAPKKTSFPPGLWRRAAWSDTARKRTVILCSGTGYRMASGTKGINDENSNKRSTGESGK